MRSILNRGNTMGCSIRYKGNLFTLHYSAVIVGKFVAGQFGRIVSHCRMDQFYSIQHLCWTRSIARWSSSGLRTSRFPVWRTSSPYFQLVITRFMQGSVTASRTRSPTARCPSTQVGSSRLIRRENLNRNFCPQHPHKFRPQWSPPPQTAFKHRHSRSLYRTVLIQVTMRSLISVTKFLFLCSTTTNRRTSVRCRCEAAVCFFTRSHSMRTFPSE